MGDSKLEHHGVGFMGALAIAFIVLKLCGVVSWPWWAVLAPLWAPLALAAVALAIACLVAYAIGDG